MRIFDNNVIKQKFWRRASESESSLRFFFVFAFCVFSPAFASSQEAPNETPITNSKYYYYENPYVPQLKDYGLELGSMMMESGLYWLGANFGLHSGNCLFYKDPSCQQYYDLGFGAGGRDGETEYIGTVSARFQWVRFPSSWSPFTRVFAGVLNTIYPPTAEHYFTYGLGIGITHRLHEHLDLRLEIRGGHGYMGYAQAIVGMQLKIDDVIGDFADKVKGFGKGTLETTSDVIEGTVEGTKKVFKGIGDAVSPKSKSKDGEKK